MNEDREIHFYHLFTVNFERHFPSRNSESTIRNVDSQCLNFMWSRGIELIITMCIYFFILVFQSLLFPRNFFQFAIYVCAFFFQFHLFRSHSRTLTMLRQSEMGQFSYVRTHNNFSENMILNQPIRICYKKYYVERTATISMLFICAPLTEAIQQHLFV